MGVDPLPLPPLPAPSSVLVPPPLQSSPVCGSLLIVWPSRCLSGPSLYVAVTRKHLSYHCPDNSLLVQKSLRALRSHDDDMVTLPGGSEPPAEIAYPFPSPSVSSSAHPFPLLFFFRHRPLRPRSSLSVQTGICRHPNVGAGEKTPSVNTVKKNDFV